MRGLHLKKRRFMPFLAYTVCALCIFSAAALVFMSSAYTALAEAGVSSLARSALYSAINSVSENRDFLSLTEIFEDEGNIRGLSLNSAKANKIASLFASEANAVLSKEEYSVFSIPVGNLTGIPLLSGRGFKIPLRIVPLGSIDATVKSDFSDAGINQTKHSVYIDAKVTLRLMAPFSDKVTSLSVTIPLSETVIAGDIPFFYAPGIK
ncbi:MAG: sporulation protein YunB [Clostridia bacterium]|nr:sporulation protein YunB [Clostridia bacterium]